MLNIKKLVSIVVPVYNGQEHISQCLNSLINQTYENIEIIIVNDGSTDRTNELLVNYSQIDKRINIIKNKSNFGITKSLNLAIKQSMGEIIVRQDIDEIASLNRIELQLKYLVQNNLILVGSNCINIYPNGFSTEWGNYKNKEIPKILKYRSPFPHGTTIFKKSEFIKCKGYNNIYKTSQDFDLWVKMSKIGNVGMMKDILVKRKIDNKSISKNKKFSQAYDSTRIRFKNAKIINIPQIVIFSFFSLFISLLPNNLFFYYVKIRKKII